MLQELVFTVKVLPPPIVIVVVLAPLFPKNSLEIFHVLAGEFPLLWFRAILQLNPIVEGGAQKMENELRVFHHSVFVDFFWVDLNQILHI